MDNSTTRNRVPSNFDTPTGEFAYTPSADFIGTDTFTFQVNDGTATAKATVTVTVTS